MNVFCGKRLLVPLGKLGVWITSSRVFLVKIIIVSGGGGVVGWQRREELPGGTLHVPCPFSSNFTMKDFKNTENLEYMNNLRPVMYIKILPYFLYTFFRTHRWFWIMTALEEELFIFLGETEVLWLYRIIYAYLEGVFFFFLKLQFIK